MQLAVGSSAPIFARFELAAQFLNPPEPRVGAFHVLRESAGKAFENISSHALVLLLDDALAHSPVSDYHEHVEVFAENGLEPLSPRLDEKVEGEKVAIPFLVHHNPFGHRITSKIKSLFSTAKFLYDPVSSVNFKQIPVFENAGRPLCVDDARFSQLA